MKKSEVFYIAQLAVVNSLSIDKNEKLEVLRVLMEQEDIAKMVEKHNEELKGEEKC